MVTVSDRWRLDHPWARFYPWAVEQAWLSTPVGAAVFGTDMGRFRAAIERVGQVPAGAAVLDVPCGGGIALRGLRPGQGVRYVAADIAPTMLERTRRAAQERGVADQVETLEADVAALPVSEATYDLCLSLTGLHCFPDPRAALLELGRVTRPSGELVASWLRTDAGPRYAPVIRAARTLGIFGPSASTSQVRRWLAEAGFTDVDLQTSGSLAYVTARRTTERP